MAGNDFWGDWVTPDLARNPGLATDAINSKQPNVVAPLLSAAAKSGSAVDAINDNSETNQNKSFWDQLGHKALTGLEWLGKPLKEVQKDYKFLHAVYTDHGFLPGFAATLGIAGAGLAGSALGPAGAAIAADLAATGIRKGLGQLYTDSYKKSEDENYKVSPGRDFTNVISKGVSAIGFDAAAKAFNQNRGLGKIVSGLGDLSFDVTADPVQVVGRFGQMMRTGKYLAKTGELELKYPIMDTIPGVKNFVASRSLVPVNSEQMDLLRAGTGIFNGPARQYNRALDDIATTIADAKAAGTPQLAAGELIQKYPQMGTANVGRMVQENLDTADKVHDYFKTSMYLGEVDNNLAGQAILPSRTLLRAKAGDSQVIDYLRNDGSLPSKIYQTFSGYMPYSVNQEGKLSLNKFKWDAPDAATVVYRIGRMGLGDRAAKIFAGKYAEAVASNDQGLARSIKNQAVWESLKGIGLPDDNRFVKAAWDELNKVDVPQVSTQVYGTDVLGNPLGQYTTASGIKTGGLTSLDKSDTFDIPNFIAIKNELRSYGMLKQGLDKLDQETGGAINKVLYGHNDEFIVDRYVNKIFKPLALATAGFGLRVAAAELIPTFARYGIGNTFKAKLAVAAAKANTEVAPKEAGSVLSAALVGLGAHMGLGPDFVTAGYPAFQEAKRLGLKFASKLVPDDQLELATKLVLANGGHFLSDAVSTGHGYDASTAYQNRQAADYYYQINRRNVLFKELKDYTTYTPTDKHYGIMLTTNLNKAASNTTYRNIAGDLVKNVEPALSDGKLQIENIIGKEAQHQSFQDLRTKLVDQEEQRMLDAVAGKYHGYDDELNTITRWHDAMADGTMRQFAQDRVDALLGKVIGRDGTYNPSFAEGIVNKSEFGPKEILGLTKTNPNSLPAGVSGPILDEYIPGDFLKLNFITNLGFKKVIDPIVNGLSREPLYMLHVGDAYSQLKPLIGNGLTDDQALRIAQTRASYAMLPQIHNTALRNQFAQLARNYLPFYFAQEQALKRAFNTLKDTSVASPLFSRGLRFYQLSEHAINNPGFVQKDDNGNSYFYFPGLGGFGQALQNTIASYNMPMVSGLPITIRGSMTSLKSVLPELTTPGVAPFVAVSGNILSDFFPSLRPAVEGTVGKISMDRPMMDIVIPATWAKSLLAQMSSFDFTHQMSNALAGAMAAAYYHGQVPSADSSKQEKQAFVDRIKNNARSILLIKTFLGLTSPLSPQISQEDAGFRDEFWKMVKQKGNFADALMTFLGEHGDKAVSYTVAKTEAAYPGGKIPYIQGTVDFINQNKDLFFSKDPNKSLATGAFFLIPQDPAAISNRSAYNELLGMHFRSQRTPLDLLNAFYVAQGDAIMRPLEQEHAQILNNAYDPYTRQQENTRWKAIMTKMENLYPTWYANITSSEGKTNATVAYNQLQNIFNNKLAPDTEQTKLVAGLMRDYQAHKATMDQYKMVGIQGFAVNSEKQNWDNYLTQLSANEPRLTPVINSVFRKLG